MYTLFDKVFAGLAAVLFTVPFVTGCALPVTEPAGTVSEMGKTENEVPVEVDGEFNQRVSFELPDNWVSEKQEDVWPGSERDSYVHHVKGNILEEKLAEGVLFQKEVAFIEGGLQNTFDYAYAECVMNNPEPAEGEDVLYVSCIRNDLKDWEKMDFGEGITGYRSDIVGVPESGEEMEELYIVFEEENMGVYFRAAYYNEGIDSKRKKAIIGAILDSVDVK